MLILATGGTFDKDYDLTSGQLIFAGTCIPQLIHEARLTTPHRLDVLMQKDSLEMTLSDRMVILEACRAASEKHIVIIHGTDTMTDTALFLQSAEIDKTIVLTGAMRPHAFGESDASFNLGYAIAAAQLHTHGVYIAIQGELFNADKVQKNRQLGQFTHTP